MRPLFVQYLFPFVIFLACAGTGSEAYAFGRRPVTVGIISGADAFLGMADSFRAGMSALGFKEGRNITYDIRRFNSDCPSENKALADFIAAFSLISDNEQAGRLAARMAAKILRGARAGELPVETPEAKLRLNYKRLKIMGVKVPEGLLRRADEIIR